MNSSHSPLSRSLKALAFAGLALSLSNCAAVKKSGHYGHDFDPPVTQPTNPSNVKIKVSTGAGRVYAVEGSKVLLASPCAVGVNGATGQGSYTIGYKDARKRRVSEPDSGYPMAYWQEWKPAYGLHWGFVKPYPCTHGCIRLPMNTARKLFSLTKVGTPINISASQPEDATIGKTLPTIDDGPLPNPNRAYLNSSEFFEDAAAGRKLRF